MNEEKRQSLNTFREMLSRPSLAVIGLVVLTILSALTLLKLQYDARVRDLDRQYARSSAHAGRQLELHLETYTTVVKNLSPAFLGGERATQVAQERAEAALRRQYISESLQNESAAAAKHQANLDALKDEEDAVLTKTLALSKQLKKARSQKSVAEKKKKTAEKVLLEKTDAFEDALAAFTEARAAVTAQRAVVAERGKEADRAAAKAKDAAKRLDPREPESDDESQPEPEPEAQPKPESQPEPEAQPEPEPEHEHEQPLDEVKEPSPPAEDQPADSTPPQTEPSNATDQPTPRQREPSEAQRKHEQAKKAALDATRRLEAEQVELEALSKTEARALEAKNTASKELKEAIAELEKVGTASETLLKAVRAWTKAANDVSVVVDQLRGERSDAESEAADTELRRTELRKALDDLNSRDTSAIAWERLKESVFLTAPPSYEEDLEECFDFTDGSGSAVAPWLRRSDAAERKRLRCIFKRLFEANNIGDKLRFRACELRGAGPARTPFLSSDRQSILFPVPLDKTLAPACFEVSLHDLVNGGDRVAGSPWIADEHAAAAEMVVLGRDGKNLVSDPASSVRIDRLPGFESTRALASARMAAVELEAEPYRVYLQPVGTRLLRTPAESGPGEPQIELVVATLLPQEEFDAESLRLGPIPYLAASLSLLLVLLSFPFMKLWGGGGSTRFAEIDVVAIATCTGLLALVATATVWSLLARAHLRDRVDLQLADAAEELASALDIDYRGTRGVLDAFVEETHELQQPWQERECSDNSWSTHEEDTEDAKYCEETCYAFPRKGLRPRERLLVNVGNSWLGSWLIPSNRRPTSDAKGKGAGEQNAPPTSEREPATSDAPAECKTKCDDDLPRAGLCGFAPCIQGAWADADGKQRLKYAACEHSAVPADIANRMYFQRALESVDCNLVRDAQNEQDPRKREELVRAVHPNVAEVVRSATMLRSISIVAKATCPEDGTKPDGVAAVWSSPDILKRVVLPPGFAAVVVDTQGRVMLHSDSGVYNGHVVFEDVEEPVQLKDVLDGHVAEALDARYLETPVRMYTRFVEGPRWHIIVMAPNDEVGGDILGMVLLTLLGCGAFFAGQLALLALGSLLSRIRGEIRNHKKGLPRPNTARSKVYLGAGLTGMVLTAVFVVGCATVWLPRPMMWWAFLIMVAFAMLAWFAPRSKWWIEFFNGVNNEVEKRVSPSFATRYTVWFVGLASVFYVCPASFFFSLSYQHILSNRVRAEQVHCVRSNADGTEPRTCVGMRTLPQEGSPTSGFPNAYAFSAYRADAHEDDEAAEAAVSSEPPVRLAELLGSSLLGHELTGFEHRLAETREWDWTEHGESLTLRRREIRLRSSVRKPVTLAVFGWGWLLVGMSLFIAVIVVVWVVHQSLCRLFFLRVMNDLPPPPGEPEAGAARPILPFKPEEYWDTVADRDEGYVLKHSALRGILPPHPRHTTTVRALLREGVLDRHNLQIRSAAFVRHIRTLHAQGKISLDTARDDRWGRVRAPIVTAFMVAVIAVGSSEPALSATGLVAPALAAMLPAVLRMFSVVGSVRADR